MPSPFLAKRRVMSHSTTHSASDWRSAPERDFLAYRLIGLAELHLDSYFADPAGTGDYQRPSRRTSGRGTVPRALASWKRDGVTLTLARLPDDAERFQVDLLSDQFSAVLRLRYLPEDMELRAARVEQFSGDIRADRRRHRVAERRVGSAGRNDAEGGSGGAGRSPAGQRGGHGGSREGSAVRCVRLRATAAHRGRYARRQGAGAVSWCCQRLRKRIHFCS